MVVYQRVFSCPKMMILKPHPFLGITSTMGLEYWHLKSNFDRNLKGGYRFGYMFKDKTYRLIYRVNHPVNRSYAVVRYFVKYRWGTCSRQPKKHIIRLGIKDWLRGWRVMGVSFCFSKPDMGVKSLADQKLMRLNNTQISDGPRIFELYAYLTGMFRVNIASTSVNPSFRHGNVFEGVALRFSCLDMFFCNFSNFRVWVQEHRWAQKH